MFRLMFAPDATPGKGEIEVLDKVYVEFNIFKIDLQKRVLSVGFECNCKNGYIDYNEAVSLLREGWDISKLEYSNEGSLYHIKIPEGYSVITVLK